MSEPNLEKQKAIKQLFISEEDTIAKLKELVELSKPYFGIERPSGKIILNHSKCGSNINKISLFLIGKYFAKEGGLIENGVFTLKEISEGIGVIVTTLSGPLGTLVNSGIVDKKGDSHKIVYHKIEGFLKSISHHKDRKETKKFIIKKVQTKKPFAKKSTITELKIKRELIPHQENIKKLADDSEVEVDDLNKIYDFDDNLTLIANSDGHNEAEKQLKATLLILTGYNYYFNESEIDSSKLRLTLEDLGIVSLVNLSTNLKPYRNLIVHKKGKRGNTETTYKITLPGLEKGKMLIRAFSGKIRKDDEELSLQGSKGLQRKSSGLVKEIEKLCSEGFFNNFVNVSQVKEELEKRHIFNKRQDVDAYLRKVLLGKKLIRDKKKGIWHYVIKK